jgi:tRNA-dihydrouridine synthase
MIGRGAMGNPWIFEQALAQGREGRHRVPTPEQRLDTIERHMELLAGLFEDRMAYGAMLKKYVAAYSKGLAGSATFRHSALEASDPDTIIELTRRFFGGEREAA